MFRVFSLYAGIPRRAFGGVFIGKTPISDVATSKHRATENEEGHLLGGRHNLLNRTILMAPEVGLEPTTLRLTAECSAIELLRNMLGRRSQNALR